MFFFFNDTATTEIYTLSLHDALPICQRQSGGSADDRGSHQALTDCGHLQTHPSQRMQRRGRVQLPLRSEEHTSELQSRQYLVCRLLLEKKKKHSRAASQTTTN